MEEISRREDSVYLETEKTCTDEGMRDNDCNTFHGRNDVALIKQALEFIETLRLV